MTRLNKKQQEIVMKWINNEADEKKLCKKYKISYKKWSRWISSKFAQEEIKGRTEAAKKGCEILMAKYLQLATAKLIEQCNSENNETSRKACLEIIALCGQHEPIDVTAAIEIKNEPVEEFDEETQSKLLEVLANSKKNAQIR